MYEAIVAAFEEQWADREVSADQKSLDLAWFVKGWNAALGYQEQARLDSGS